jgi:hypothetical protein
MSIKKLPYLALLATLYVWALLLWDYLHQGVPTHTIMARADMPGFSNWWGGLLIPLLALWLTYRLRQRITQSTTDKIPLAVLWMFAGALLYGATLSAAFAFDLADVPFYLLIGLLVLALFLPVYRSEFFLGLVLGMIYTFGGVLPILIVSIVSAIGFVVYSIVQFVLSRLVNKQ